MTDADRDMVTFIYDRVIVDLDQFVIKAEDDVERGAMNDAEEARLAFKTSNREITERLEKFSGELSELVMQFSAIARMPVTLQ